MSFFSNLALTGIAQQPGNVLSRVELELWPTGLNLEESLKLTLFQINQARERREAGDLMVDIARSYNVSGQTIRRL